jgi:hypothetical protein
MQHQVGTQYMQLDKNTDKHKTPEVNKCIQNFDWQTIMKD